MNNERSAVVEADKALAYARCLSMDEYFLVQADQGRLLQMRVAETRLTPAAQVAMSAYPEFTFVVALVTDEDPDTTAVLPVIARLVDVSTRVHLRILSDTGDLTPLARLLPEIDIPAALEEWDLPVFFVFDDEWELQAQWGPRPAQAERNLEEWLRRYPEYETLAEDETAAGQARFAALTTALTYEMRIWYNSSLAAACQSEFCTLLTGLLPPEEVNEGES